jgi:hypothetical protein
MHNWIFFLQVRVHEKVMNKKYIAKADEFLDKQTAIRGKTGKRLTCVTRQRAVLEIGKCNHL